MQLKHKHKIAVTLFVALLGILLYSYLNRPKVISVVVKSADTGVVQNTVANTRAGTLMASRRASLSPSVGGQIASLDVSEGDQVTAGQLLLELWNDDLTAQVELASQEAAAALARADEACVVAQVARREAERLKKLRKKGVASEEAVDQAEGEASAKTAGCRAAKANIGVSEAKLNVAQAALDKTRLLAPFDGTVAEVNGELGEFVTPSPIGVPTPPAVDLIDTTSLYVSAPIDEVDAPDIRTAMPAMISLDAFGKKRFAGTVRRVAPYVLDREKQARTVDVEVTFIDKQATDDMLPGYSADIEVVLVEKTKVLRIPSEAIIEGNRVLVFSEQTGVLEQRQIETGLQNWEYTEVLSGVRDGEQIVVSVDREGVEDAARAIIDNTTAVYD
jgi:HlyD family secretion protein